MPGINSAECMCPNGFIYPVADKWDSCESVNCKNGKIVKKCLITHLNDGKFEMQEGSYRGVNCGYNSYLPDFKFEKTTNNVRF